MPKTNPVPAVLIVAFSSLQMAGAFAQAPPSIPSPPILSVVPFGASSLATASTTFYSWMNPEVSEVWALGFKGRSVTITVIDDFKSRSAFSGNLGDGVRTMRHGEWTFKEAGMISPEATMRQVDFSSPTAISMATGLNVLNLSYGINARDGYSISQIAWDAQDRSIINVATKGMAVIAKAAGNDAVAVSAAKSGQKDYFNLALIGAPSTIFVGALNKNGTTTDKASLASYSNYAGSDVRVQNNFLVVGVRGDLTRLYGTSFAAPIISGYAAILGSKFTMATPTQITNQLLTTARQDTLMNYSATTYGRGEASIKNALAPVSIR